MFSYIFRRMVAAVRSIDRSKRDPFGKTLSTVISVVGLGASFGIVPVCAVIGLDHQNPIWGFIGIVLMLAILLLFCALGVGVEKLFEIEEPYPSTGYGCD